MKTKITILFLCLSAILLFSCEKTDPKGLFGYQDSVRCVSGTVSKGGEDYNISLYFDKGGDQKNKARRIEYHSPETIKGLSFTLEGDKVTAELADVRIANSLFDSDSVFFVEKLFLLREEDIYSIESTKEKTTVAKGKNENESWQVTTDEKGSPKEIVYNGKDEKCIFKIDKIEKTEK